MVRSMENLDWLVALVGFGFILPAICVAALIYCAYAGYRFFNHARLSVRQKVLASLSVLYVLLYVFAQRVI